MTESYIIELERLRAQLVSILTSKGKTVASDATLHELIPLVSSIGINNQFKTLCNGEPFEIIDTEGEISTVWNWLHSNAKSKITKLVSSSVTSLREASLLNASNLTELNVPNCGLVEYQATQGLTNLTKITLADTVNIANNFLYDAYSIKNINLGYITSQPASFLTNLRTAETVKINRMAGMNFGRQSSAFGQSFENCPLLKIVDFGETPNFYGGSDPWRLDSNIKAIVIRNDTVATLGTTNCFMWLKNNVTGWHIYVPDALVDSYKVATNWSTFADYFKPLSEYDEETILNGEVAV